MKKIFIVMAAFALAFSAVAPVAASADTIMASSFNTNLTVGSRGASVVALQSFLVSKGLLTIPAGTAMGYFGGLTKAAVAAYQVSKGITPTAGYFGPITRAAVMADASVTTTTTTTTAGCPAGALFNSMTGASCATTTTTTTTTTGITTGSTEGTLDVRLASNPSDNANVRVQTDVPVYGIEFRARIADVAVQTVDLQVGVVNAGSSENPATLVNTIKVWDGSNVIATVPVNLTTFTKDQNQVYYYRLSGLNFIVPKDVTKTLTFSFSTNSIDTNRTVTIDGYQSSSVRAVSGNGVSSFYSIDGSAYTRTHTFVKPGTSTLTLTAATTPLRSQNYRNNGTDSLQNVTLGTFNVKSESGDSTLLTVSATSSGVVPTTVYLYQGSTLLKSKTGSTTISFDNLDSTNGSKVSQNTIQTYTIKADYAASTTVAASSTVSVTGVTYQTPNGNTALASGNTVNNVPVYIYIKAASVALAGTPSITVTNPSVTTGTSTLTATFPLSITAMGGNVTLPTSADFTVVFSNGTNYTATSTVTGASISVVTIPNNDISDGSTANVTVTASANSNLLLTNGLYNAALTSIKWSAGNGVVTQTYGLDDFKTSASVQFNR